MNNRQVFRNRLNPPAVDGRVAPGSPSYASVCRVQATGFSSSIQMSGPAKPFLTPQPPFQKTPQRGVCGGGRVVVVVRICGLDITSRPANIYLEILNFW